MKNSSNFVKKTLQLFIILLVGFLGGVVGTWAFSHAQKSSSTTTNNQKITTVNTSYKNSNSTNYLF